MKSITFTKADVKVFRLLKNWAITIAALSVACIICSAIKRINSSDLYVPMIFVLAVLIISLMTDGYFYGVFSSFVSVLGVNWAFTYPYMKLDFSIYGYPTTFLTMLAVSLVISALTTRVHEQEKLRHDSEQAQLRANLLRAVSHDLRTPLTSIIGSLSAVIDGGDNIDKEQKISMLTDAKEDAEWLVRMVENLLSITRISGSTTENIQKSPELIEEIVGDCVTKFKKRNPDVVLKVKVPDTPLTVSVDAMLIEQVIMNLMDNAVHHAEGMTELCVNVTQHKCFAQVSVSDNGKGLDPYTIDDLFKGQLVSSDGQSPDSNKFRGIGLAVCKAIITAHGGRISADNKPTGGAVFTFTVPLESEESEE